MVTKCLYTYTTIIDLGTIIVAFFSKLLLLHFGNLNFHCVHTSYILNYSKLNKHWYAFLLSTKLRTSAHTMMMLVLYSIQ